MKVIKITGGYHFNLKNEPSNNIRQCKSIKQVALSMIGFDYIKPKVIIKEGDEVLLGDVLCFDKKNLRIKFVSPANGLIDKICYGPRRKLKFIVINIFNNEKKKKFDTVVDTSLNNLTKKHVINQLLDAGFWQLFDVSSQFNYIPIDDVLNNKIHSLYISSFNSDPHGVDNKLLIKGQEKYFIAGLKILSCLFKNIYIFVKQEDMFFYETLKCDNIIIKVIENKYPVHKLGVQAYYNNENEERIVVGSSVELAINVGYLFLSGFIRVERIFSISDNISNVGCHYLSRVGISLNDLYRISEQKHVRYIAGGLLSGRKIEMNDFLGLKEFSINVVQEDTKRIPLVFFRFGWNKVTLSKTWLGFLNNNINKMIGTSNHGEKRACIQCNYCTDVCPVDLMPSLIMKSAINNDIEKMEYYSIHSCVDCELCTFVCPSKIEVNQDIRYGKNLIIKEG